MKQFILLVTFALSLGACSKSQPISSGPYQALKCGINRRISSPSKFIFHKNNGYLYYFDSLTDTFNPLTRIVEEGIYLNSMEEFSSKLETNFLLGNKLIIKQIDYFGNKPQRKSIVKNTINLRSLVMDTIYQSLDGKQIRSKKYCVWIDPKLS